MIGEFLPYPFIWIFWCSWVHVDALSLILLVSSLSIPLHHLSFSLSQSPLSCLVFTAISKLSRVVLVFLDERLELSFTGCTSAIAQFCFAPVLGWTPGVTRHDSLSKTISQGTLEGRRRRGLQRKCWMDNVKEWTFLPMPELLTRTSCRVLNCPSCSSDDLIGQGTYNWTDFLELSCFVYSFLLGFSSWMNFWSHLA